MCVTAVIKLPFMCSILQAVVFIEACRPDIVRNGSSVSATLQSLAFVIIVIYIKTEH